MREDRSGREGLFQLVERFPAVLGEVPRSAFPREPSEGYDNIGVSENESTVEVGKA